MKLATALPRSLSSQRNCWGWEYLSDFSLTSLDIFPTLVLSVISNQNLSYYKFAIDVCFHRLLIGSRILNCKEDSSADHYCGLERSHKGSKTGSIEFCSRPWVGIPQYYCFKHLIFFQNIFSSGILESSGKHIWTWFCYLILPQQQPEKPHITHQR